MACLALDYRALDPCELARSKTIKLEGTWAGYPILLLVDSVTSHNFIAREMVVIAYPKGFAKLYQSELVGTLLRSVPMCWIWGDSTWSWG